MQLSITDLGTLADIAQKLDANPLALAGRVAGLSDAEQRAGIPAWAWVSVAFVAGAALAWRYGPELRERLGR